MPLQVNVDHELSLMEQNLDTLEARASESTRRIAAEFVQNHILNDRDISWRIANNYLTWVLTHGLPHGEVLSDCVCVAGWQDKEDGTVIPCGRCQSERYQTWWEGVDESWDPS